MPQGAQGKLRANKGQQWNKEQQPLWPAAAKRGGYDGLPEQLLREGPPGAQAAGRRREAALAAQSAGPAPGREQKPRCGQAAQLRPGGRGKMR